MNWKPDYTVTPQRIVCAANKHPNGTNGIIVIGVRHFDAIMLSTIELRQQVQRHEQWGTSEEGFVDQFGDFVDRKTAWIIACKANQIFRLVGGQTKDDLGKYGIDLYSENLY